VSNLLEGSLVRLSVADTDEVVRAWSKWNADTEFKRLLDDQPPTMMSPAQQRRELEQETRDDKNFYFAVRPMNFDAKIGFTALWVNWLHHDAFVAIGIGERMYWGKGYGTDAMRITLRYAFEELDLHRVSLSVWAVNARAIRSYINAGFKLEGRVRESMQRDGTRMDMLLMGVLRSEFRVPSAEH
jgi:RimJ/RimL family protein N-acetyltransferase